MRYLICLSFIFSASLSAGTIHKWVDEDGNVHYGDSPPVSVTTKPVRVIGAPSDPGKALPRLGTSGDSGSASDSTTDEPDPSTVPEDQAKIACDEARKDFKALKSSSRVRLKSADGTTRYLTTEEIDERRKSSEEDIEKFCR